MPRRGARPSSAAAISVGPAIQSTRSTCASQNSLRPRRVFSVVRAGSKRAAYLPCVRVRPAIGPALGSVRLRSRRRLVCASRGEIGILINNGRHAIAGSG